MIASRIGRNVRALTRLFGDENRTQKASLNALAFGLDYMARMVVGFLITPYLVAGLGDALFGVWKTLGSLTGYITAASGRPSQALKWTIANQQSSDDYEEKRRQVGSALLVWLLFLPLMTALGGLLVWFAPLWIQGIETELFGVVRLAAALLVGQMILISLAYLPQAVLEGENLGYRRIGLSMALVILGGGLTLLVLYLGWGLVGVALVSLVNVALSGLLYLYIVRAYVPWFGMARPAREAAQKFAGLSGWFVIWRLVSQLMRASDLLILGFFASTELVTTYALTKYAPETLISIVAMVAIGSAPGLGGLIGAGNLARAREVREEIMLLTWLILTVFGGAILLWNRTFISFWVAEEHFAGSLENLLVMLLIGQFALIRNDAIIIDLTLDISRKVIVGASAALLATAIGALLVARFDAGITGMVLGLIGGRAVLSILYPLFVGRFLDLSLSKQLLAVTRPLLTTMLLFVGLYYLDQLVGSRLAEAVPGWIELGLLGLLTLAGFTVLVALVGLTTGQRNRLIHRAQKILRKGS